MQPYGNYNNYYNQPPQYRLDKVASLEDARKYSISPNAVVYLIDQENPFIYVKAADNIGHTTLRAFSLTEIDPEKINASKYITRDDFEAFKSDLLKTIKGGAENG